MCFILGISTTMIGQIKLQTILSQLKITKVNITENLESKTTKSLQKNARILKRKENEKKNIYIYIYIIFYCAFCLPQWSSYCCLNFESF